MREFNTTGPCNPTLHYTIMREKLMAEGKAKVHQGRFFTLFAPRQTGKTTYFQLLLEELKHEGIIPIWISFESLKTVTRERFYQALTIYLQRELAEYGIKIEFPIVDSIGLGQFFATSLFERKGQGEGKAKPIVLIIDEFEGIPDEVLSEVMHAFREIYHQKNHYALHSLILVGVSTIAELVVGPASPFNIAEELELPYFTFEEVNKLIQQYTAESGQLFEPSVIRPSTIIRMDSLVWLMRCAIIL